MKLSLRSVGGVTGPAGAITHTVDLSAMPPEQRARPTALVEAAQPFQLAERYLSKSPKPWDFRFTLTVDENGRQRTIEFHLAAAPPALRALAEWLQEQQPDQR
jgi:emfourin